MTQSNVLILLFGRMWPFAAKLLVVTLMTVMTFWALRRVFLWGRLPVGVLRAAATARDRLLICITLCLCDITVMLGLLFGSLWALDKLIAWRGN